MWSKQSLDSDNFVHLVTLHCFTSAFKCIFYMTYLCITDVLKLHKNILNLY